MRTGFATLITLLLLVSAAAFAPTWAIVVLACMLVAAVAVDVARWRQERPGLGSPTGEANPPVPGP